MYKTIFNADEKYNLANEVIAAIAKEGTIQKFVLYSNFEDKAEEIDMPLGIFRRNFEGLMKWLSDDLKLILYTGNSEGLVTLSSEGESLYSSNSTVKAYIEYKDKLKADKEATIVQNLRNARLDGIYKIVKIIATIVGSILIPLAGFLANDIVRTTAISIGSLIIGALWGTDIGKIIRRLVNIS